MESQEFSSLLACRYWWPNRRAVDSSGRVLRAYRAQSSCCLSRFFSLTLQHFAADNSKAGSAASAPDKELATFGNGIICVVVAFLRMLPKGHLHRVVLVHIVDVYLCKTRVFTTATRHYTNTRTIGEVA